MQRKKSVTLSDIHPQPRDNSIAKSARLSDEGGSRMSAVTRSSKSNQQDDLKVL